MSRSIIDKLLEKSKEAMVAAVQTYNNPSIFFKSEIFIITAIVSWTYLMHAYFRKNKIDYRYFEFKGRRKLFCRTGAGGFRYWDLGRCLSEQNPLNKDTINNLRFLLGIRHEIEHQRTDRIDEYIGAKLQACALNYNRELISLFGDKHSIKDKLSFVIQFSSIDPIQEQSLRTEVKKKIPSNVYNFITEFESNLSDDELKSLSYSYKIIYVPLSVNKPNQADKAIEFIRPGTEMHENVERVLFKMVEKNKYLPKEIVKIMKDEGFDSFNMHKHIKLWKEKDAKNPNYHYGVDVSGQWYWYDNWIEIVRSYCRENYA